jgi:hypothetical protein
VKFHSHTNRRPLSRAQAARVVAAPMPNRTSERLRAIARHRRADRLRPGCMVHALCWLTVLGAWALAWIVAFAW